MESGVGIDIEVVLCAGDVDSESGSQNIVT